MRYATPETVYRLLSIDPENPYPEGILETLEDLEEGIAANIDAACNCTFGNEPVAETRRLSSPHATYLPSLYTDRVYMDDGRAFFFDPTILVSNIPPLISQYGMRNITSVVAGGTWNGLSWDDETILADDEWELVFTRADGWSMGIVIGTEWYRDARVTAEWEDQSSNVDVPADIREAVTMIVADQYRILTQSPTGELGPPGLVTYIRDIWDHEPVKRAIANHRVYPVVV